jgi:GDP-L-fucose synthase
MSDAAASRDVVLVTGGSGLVGKAVEDFVKANPVAGETWVYLTSKDGDLRSLEACKAIFETHKPTHVIHLAAFVGGLFRNLKYKVEFYRYNVLMNDNIMECCRIYGVSWLAEPACQSFPLFFGYLQRFPPPFLRNTSC